MIMASSLSALLWMPRANRGTSSRDAMPVSINSAYPEMAVRGVFSSWDTFAVNSWRNLALFKISLCCSRILARKGASSWYAPRSVSASIFPASLSMGATNFSVKKCAIYRPARSRAARIHRRSGNTLLKML